MNQTVSFEALSTAHELDRLRRLIARLRMRGHTATALLRSSDRDDSRTHAGGAAPARVAHAERAGKVYLVGAGPGDADLLTLRAARLLGSADVIVYDQLIGDDVLSLAHAHADCIYVGKRAGRHSMPQEAINALLVSLGKKGMQVVRLKGGDPFIFGRGGEEIEALLQAAIAFEVVPGVTAASGMAAYAGIPLTHRNFAQSCVFVTGHLKDGSANLDWSALARPNQTVVIYMGVGALADICSKLIAHGLPPTMPSALVQRATLPDQRTVTGTLATLAEIAIQHKITAPALIVVGEVVRLHERFDWFERIGQDAVSTAT